MNGADAHPADTSPLPDDRLYFLVVGIGASAGGITALVHLSESVPSNLEMEVDDTPDALESFAMLLEIEGAQVTAVGSAQEALKALDQGQFDLLVSDVAMPDMDGYALGGGIACESCYRHTSGGGADRIRARRGRETRAGGRFRCAHAKPVAIEAMRAGGARFAPDAG